MQTKVKRQSELHGNMQRSAEMPGLGRKYKNKEWLHSQYYGKKLSIIQIAEQIKISPTTIYTWCEDNSFKLRKHTGRIPDSKTREKLSARQLGNKNHNWKGGKFITSGYVRVKVLNHPSADKKGYVAEHRLVMEKHLGRYLAPTEIVHHRNSKRDDNRIENLELKGKVNHYSSEYCCPHCSKNILSFE